MMITQETLKEWLPSRNEQAHKGVVGRTLVIAGSVSMLGAAVLTAKAALRTGCGLVSLATVEEAVPHINIAHPELIVKPLPSNPNGQLGKKAFSLLDDYIHENTPNAIAIGPGLGRNPDTREVILKVLKETISMQGIPTVIDADALNAFNLVRITELTEHNFILTPHHKEFERLFGEMPSYNPDNRAKLANSAHGFCKQTVVLKGHQTIVKGETHCYTNTTGNSGMATGGSGDVLTGMIASLIAQGGAPEESAILGVYLHGAAGDLAAEEYLNGLIASDIIDHIPDAIQELSFELNHDDEFE